MRDRIEWTPDAPLLGYRRISHFYFPLLLTSVIGLMVHPMLTFFMGRAASPVESLAVFPVVHALSFIFRALGLSFQDAAIALLGRDNEHFPELARFGAVLGLAATAGLAAVAFTPLADVWFVTISGLSPELASFAYTPTRILVILPALSVLLSFQRAILMQSRVTRPITVATMIEVSAIAILFIGRRVVARMGGGHGGVRVVRRREGAQHGVPGVPRAEGVARELTARWIDVMLLAVN